MKRFYFPLVVALLVGMTATANAQCFGGSCRSRASFRTSYASTCYGGCYGSSYNASYGACPSSCYAYAPTYGSYAAIRTCAPCQSVSVEPCAPVSEPAPCAQTQEMVENEAAMDAYCSENIGACEPVTGEYCPTCEAVTVSTCPTGACPLRQVGKNVSQRVASLLDSANAVRARYRLPALALDVNLETGSQYQAQYCASVGGLVHGAGVAEILAQNSQGLETALNQWLNSPAHRALLLNGSYRYAGVAVHRDAYGRVWCAMRFR